MSTEEQVETTTETNSETTEAVETTPVEQNEQVEAKPADAAPAEVGWKAPAKFTKAD